MAQNSNGEGVKTLEKIGDKPVNFWVKVINAKAQKERKHREAQQGRPVVRSVLEKPRKVRVLLENCHLPITQAALEEIAGVNSGTLTRWLSQYKKEEASPSMALFCNVFLRGKNQLKLIAGSVVYDEVLKGNSNLAEKIMVATNSEYNAKQIVEKTETKNINLTYQNLSDEQLDERLKRLVGKNLEIELKETKDKDGNSIYSADE